LQYPPDRGRDGVKYGWLEVKWHRCDTQASIPLDAARYPDLEIGGCAEMPVMRNAALHAARSHGQAD